jgi:hypothetical protein
MKATADLNSEGQDSIKPTTSHTTFQSTCGPIALVVMHDPNAPIPDSWIAKAVISLHGMNWEYDNRGIGEDGAKMVAVNLARYGCRDQGITAPAELDELSWSPIQVGAGYADPGNEP